MGGISTPSLWRQHITWVSGNHNFVFAFDFKPLKWFTKGSTQATFKKCPSFHSHSTSLIFYQIRISFTYFHKRPDFFLYFGFGDICLPLPIISSDCFSKDQAVTARAINSMELKTIKWLICYSEKTKNKHLINLYSK